MNFASVLLDLNLDRPLDYSIPSTLIPLAKRGARVLVPIKSSLQKGTIIGLKEKPDVPKTLEISEVLSETPPLSEELLTLALWMARYYCAPLRKVLKSILPPSIRDNMKHKTQLFVKPLLSLNELADLCVKLRAKHPLQAKALEPLLLSPKGLLLSELLEKAEISRSPVESLIKKKVLASSQVRIDRTLLIDEEYFPTKPKSLYEDQKVALSKIQSSLSKNSYETHLLYGVTGSGKTEIYLQAIEHALSLNKGTIFLVPEIALTSQTIERVRARFAKKIAILHHRLSAGERHDAWHKIKSGEAPIVIGARSAIFSPVLNLGLIIVDEEQEGSYKQTEDAPTYHARDVAVMRARLANATVVLGSATPSFESYTNAISGKYSLSLLKTRADAATLPTVTLVDMKQEFSKAGGFTLFSELLLQGIKKRLQIGEQVLLFLNRRGYHTSQMCLKCSHAIQCPHCDVNLTFHLGEKILACHLCDYRMVPPRACPHCHTEEPLKYKGAGTEMVEKSLHAILPEVRTLRLDADTTRHKGSHELLFKQFKAGKADVLIGTQMIAKGLHFPSVTLVGVLNADASLHLPDFRASEQVFQLITQVSGRSGRGALAGEVILQTHLPEHPIITLASKQDFEAFYHEEIQGRQCFHYPPFSHLIKLSFKGKSAENTFASAQAFRAELLKRLPSSFILHPVVPCGHAKVKDLYGFQFLIKAEKWGNLADVLSTLQKQEIVHKNIKLLIDVDPLSTFF